MYCFGWTMLSTLNTMNQSTEVKCIGCQAKFEPTPFCSFLPISEDKSKEGHCETCVTRGKAGKAPVLLDARHAQSVCRSNGGKKKTHCKYLFSEGSGWHCAKGTPLGIIINRRAHLMHAKGDNCSGSPDFKKS